MSGPDSILPQDEDIEASKKLLMPGSASANGGSNGGSNGGPAEDSGRVVRGEWGTLL